VLARLVEGDLAHLDLVIREAADAADLVRVRLRGEAEG
jgi:BMFP domain-containing protein YqiC